VIEKAMKKYTTLALFMIAIVTSPGQMGGEKPPAELNRVAFFLGTWRGDETYGGMGKPVTVRGTFIGTKILKGRYIQSMHRTSPVKGMGTTEGMHLLTYDPAKKLYVAHWFDSEAPNGMEITGNFVGKSLVMTGKEEMQGMPMTFKATWTPNGRSALSFKLEAEMNGKWSTFISGKYHK
jgi:ribosomal protein S6E (S10)